MVVALAAVLRAVHEHQRALPHGVLRVLGRRLESLERDVQVGEVGPLVAAVADAAVVAVVGLVALLLVDLLAPEEFLPVRDDFEYFGFFVAASAVSATAVL